MSIAMSSSRPSLPSFAALSSISTSDRKLPPLSSIFNTSSESVDPVDSSGKHSSAKLPVSPTHVSTDLSSHILASFPTPVSIKKTVRLPSFDSLKFDEKKTLDETLPLLQDSQQRSKSFSLPSSTQIPNDSSVKLSPTSSSMKATPSSVPFKVQPQKQLIQHDESPLVEKRSYAFISHSPSTYPSQEPSIDNAQLARRKRRRTTPRELAILQEEFEKGSTPNRNRRNEIANKVEMTEKAVQIWFQNRRQTLRKQSSAEKEVHHLEPIYLAHQASAGSTPIRTEPIVFSNQLLQQSFTQQQPSSPTESSQAVNTSSPSSISASRIEETSSPVNPTAIPSVQSLLVTPSRTIRSAKTSPVGGSTLTFRLTKSTTPASTTTTTAALSSVKQEKSMTPIKQQQRQRQKPVMRVNPTPPRIHSSPVMANKENFSPIKKETEVTDGLRLREPLKEIRFNAEQKPSGEKGGNEKECISNLLSLRHWK